MASEETYLTEIKSCILCGDELHSLDYPVETICDYCGKRIKCSTQCENSHYICDTCIKIPANDFIKNVCLKYNDTDPIALAVEIMNTPIIRMFGPEHHFIVPAVLITVVFNKQKRSKDELKDILNIVEQRAINEAPAHCSYNLNQCGAAIGAGIFLSIFMEQSLSTEDEWSLSNQFVAHCLKKVAESGGPRCCKRDTYLSLEGAVEFLKEKFAIELPLCEAKCTFSARNNSCGHENCSFYNLSNSLV